MARQRRASNDDEVRHPHVPMALDELRAFIPYLLNQLSNRWNSDQNRDLAAHGVNSTVLRALSVLNIHQTLTVNEIAHYAVVEQSNASRTIDSMVAEGLVERRICESDLRRREIGLTAKGRDLLFQLWPIMARNHAKLVGAISSRELQACAATLLAMIDNMGKS